MKEVPVGMVTSHWQVRHGDTARSDVWAVIDGDGRPLDLEAGGWLVRAQARETPEAKAVLLEWTLERGVELSTAQVRLASGITLTTSTVQLTVAPGDYQWIPLSWSGMFDVEIELPDTDDPAAAPLRRHTIVDDGHLTIVPGVTRART
jgi:hypothetical protein